MVHKSTFASFRIFREIFANNFSRFRKRKFQEFTSSSTFSKSFLCSTIACILSFHISNLRQEHWREIFERHDLEQRTKGWIRVLDLLWIWRDEVLPATRHLKLFPWPYLKWFLNSSQNGHHGLPVFMTMVSGSGLTSIHALSDGRWTCRPPTSSWLKIVMSPES